MFCNTTLQYQGPKQIDQGKSAVAMVSFTFSFPILQKTKLKQSVKDGKENQGVIYKDLEGCQQPNINIIGTSNSVTAASSTSSVKLIVMKNTDRLTNHCRAQDQDPATAWFI